MTPLPSPPSSPAQPFDAHRRFELLISGLLRTGVSISLAMIVTGAVLSFVHHPDYTSSTAELTRLTGSAATFPHTVNDTLTGLARFQGRAFVIAGLMVLIATPVLRVAVSILGFARQGDAAFVVITSVVLALLLLSFVLGSVAG